MKKEVKAALMRLKETVNVLFILLFFAIVSAHMFEHDKIQGLILSILFLSKLILDIFVRDDE